MVQESSDECYCFLAFPIGFVVNASRSPKNQKVAHALQ